MTDVLQTDRELDCTGLLCPMPIVKLSKEVRAMQAGQVLKMIATDKGAPADVQAWSRQTGNELLDSHEEGEQFVFFVRKKS
jgi:tRNA 2-thiouridine synthesizing protein A